MKAPSLDTEYRFIKNGNDVFIVYYDSDDEAIYSYNTADGTTVTVAEKSEETEGEALNAYVFGKDFVAFTTTVYAEAYNETAADSDSDYSRPTENYNKVYVFVPGDAKTDAGVYGKQVLDGKADVNFAKTYSLSFFESGYIFYTETGVASGSEAQTFANNLAGFKNGTDPTLIVNTDYCNKEAIIVDLNTVYAMSDTSVLKTSLVAGYKDVQKAVAKVEGSVTLLTVNGDYVYFADSDSKLTRVKFQNIDEAVETDKVIQRVSEDSVATSWYEPVIIGGKIFYCDNTTGGSSYIKYMPIDDTAVIKTEKDDAGEITLCYLEGAKLIGKFTDDDKVTMAKDKISDISETLSTGVLIFDTDDEGNVILNEDGDPVVSVIENARKAYDALGSLKGNVAEEDVKTLEKYEEALRINRLLYKLEGFDKLTDLEKTAKKADFEKAKEAIEALRVSDEFDFAEIRNLMSNNANWYYQTAKTYFDTTNG